MILKKNLICLFMFHTVAMVLSYLLWLLDKLGSNDVFSTCRYYFSSIFLLFKLQCASMDLG
jgi:hypothetical protein